MSSYTDINQLLHDERTVLIRRMPRVDGTFLSAGCSGSWYFDWISNAYGEVQRHIGIEYYSPRPEKLPENVEWIANTVGNMKDVPDASVDMLFSGQNIEHLWARDVIDFLCEAARVVKPGGFLTIDSPNRAITGPLIWSHPEHTVEFTPLEACRLVLLAGFNVMTLDGIWLQRSPRTGELLPLNPAKSVLGWSQQQRIDIGREDPDNSLLWWLVATRADRPCDRSAITLNVQRTYEAGWPERCRRFVSGAGVRSADGVCSKRGQAGPLVFGPYVPLPAGQYEAIFRIKNFDSAEDGTLGHVDIVGGAQGEQILFSNALDGAGLRECKGVIRAEFALDNLMFGIQMRVFSNGRSALISAFPELLGTDVPLSPQWDAR